jgi:hypothetical protein
MLNTLKIIIQILPYIIQLIKTIEDEIPEGGKGKNKIEYIHQVLTASYPPIIEIWETLERIITATVSLFNATGVFKKTS